MKDEYHIYLVGVSNREDCDYFCPIGCFDDEEEAIKAVTANSCDIWEGVYNYAMIQKFQKGLYPHCVKLLQYKYNIIDREDPYHGEYVLHKEIKGIRSVFKSGLPLLMC